MAPNIIPTKVLKTDEVAMYQVEAPELEYVDWRKDKRFEEFLPLRHHHLCGFCNNWIR